MHPGVVQALQAGGALGTATRVLDVGCGTGNYARALHALTDCAVVGVDPSSEMLARARASAPALRFDTGRAEALPFDDGRFDLVFSVDVIHHVEDRRAFFREARRVLTPGGRLCTFTDSADDIARRVPLSSHFPETIPVELDRYSPIPTLTTEMAAAGFDQISTEAVELAYDLDDPTPYRARAFSSLHLIDDAAFAAGLARLERDLAGGPIRALSLYTLLWGCSPAPRHAGA